MGTVSRRRKILNSDVVDILAEYRSGRATQAELAQRYGVSQAAISYITRGKRQHGLGWRLLAARRESRHAAQG